MKRPSQKKKLLKSVPPQFAPQLRPAVQELPDPLRTKLQKLGTKVQKISVRRMLALAVSVMGTLLAAQMFADWFLDLGILTRAIILLSELAGVAWFISRKFLPLIRSAPSLRDSALLVEKAWPKVMKGALIASVQLAEPSITQDSGELVQRLHRQTAMRSLPLNFNSIVATGPYFRLLAISAGLLFALSFLFVRTWPASLALLERVILLPVKVPRGTQVICLTGNQSIGVGTGIVIEARAVGVIPTQGQLTIFDEISEQRNVILEREPDHPDQFGVKIDDVQKPFTYSVQLNDGTSEIYTVKTAESASISSISFLQIFPAYTGLPPMKRTAGDLALLAGSRLQLQGFASSDIRHAEVKLNGLNQTIPLDLDIANAKKFSGEISIPKAGLKGFYILLTNEHGLISGGDKEYPIDLIVDQPPTVKILLPKRPRELCTLKLKPKISYVSADDFGLAQIDLVYRVTPDQPSPDGAGSGPIQTENIEIEKDHSKSRDGTYVWDLSSIQPPLKEGFTIEFWLQAQDANIVTGPGITESEHHVIKIATETEKRAEIMSRMMESLNGITDLSKSQQTLNQQLKDAIQGKENGK